MATATDREQPPTRSRFPVVSDSSRATMVLLPAVIAFLGSLAFAWRPSYWVDETATLSATRRPLSALPDLVIQHQDAVHGLYYALLSPWAHLDPGSAWVRFPSALATAAAAGLVAVLGSQLGSRRAGAAAGLVYAVLPVTTYYGAEARSYALASACSVAVAVCALAAVRGGARRWLVLTAVAVTLTGWVFLLGLLVVPAVILWSWVTQPRGVTARLIGVCAAGCAAVLPVAVVASRQTQQISWMQPMDLSTATRAWQVWFPGAAALGVVVWLAAATAAGLGLRDGRRGRARPRELAWMGISLTLVPIVALLVVSTVRPLWAPRYVVWSASGFALLVGSLVARVRRRALALMAVLVLFALGAPQQLAQRRVNGKGDHQSELATELSMDKRPGDAVIFTRAPWRTSEAAYPSAFAGIRDIGTAASPDASGTFTGTPASPSTVVTRADSSARVWWWHETRDRPTSYDRAMLAALADAGWRVTERDEREGTSLDLLTRL